eukprot:scaffold65725_cov63-Attheya_sp.AAC.2
MVQRSLEHSCDPQNCCKNQGIEKKKKRANNAAAPRRITRLALSTPSTSAVTPSKGTGASSSARWSSPRLNLHGAGIFLPDAEMITNQPNNGAVVPVSEDQPAPSRESYKTNFLMDVEECSKKYTKSFVKLSMRE